MLCLLNLFKHEYLWSRAYKCLLLSSSPVTITQIWPLSRYSCLYLGSCIQEFYFFFFSVNHEQYSSHSHHHFGLPHIHSDWAMHSHMFTGKCHKKIFHLQNNKSISYYSEYFQNLSYKLKRKRRYTLYDDSTIGVSMRAPLVRSNSFSGR